MKTHFSSLLIALALFLFLIFMGFHQWLLFPLLHVRAFLVGLLPVLAFFPIAHGLIQKLSTSEDLPAEDHLLYAFFGSFFLASSAAFILLTLHIGYPYIVLLLALVLILMAWGWWKKRLLKAYGSLNKSFWGNGSWVEWGLLVAATILALAAALLPPVGYDAHEYHLRAPEQFLSAGGWIAFPYNVYCAFPMNVELLYLWPIASQSPAGCTVINFFMACCAALAVLRLAHVWGMSKNVLLAPLILLATGITQWLIIQANIDLALTASTAVLLLAYERFRQDKHPVDAIMMVLALAFAFGSKYIAALAIGFPFLMMLLIDIRVIWQKKMWISLGMVFIGSGLLFMPWAIRNEILYGNPFYPLLTATWGGTPDFFHDLFRRAHAPHLDSWMQTLKDFVVLPFQKSLVESVPKGFSCLWILGIPALFMTPRNHPLYRTMTFMAASYIAWFFLTQRNDRFLASILPLMALSGAYTVHLVSGDRYYKAIRAIVWVLVTLQLFAVSTMILQPETIDYLLLPSLEQNYLSERMPHYRAIEWLNRERDKPRNRIGTVLFIGEAQSYGARFEAIVPTVFNHHPLEKGLDQTVTHILYNRSELKRLWEGYGPLGWPLGDFLQKWMDDNQKRLQLVYDAYPEKPGVVVVYEIVK